MKYKILVTGKNNPVIDDFFLRMNNDFEVMSTSARYDDVVRHLSYFKPDAVVYCVYNETRETILQIKNVGFRFAENHVPFILIGMKEECDEFGKLAPNIVDLTLYRPLSPVAILEKVKKFIRENKEQEARRAEKEPVSVVPNAAAGDQITDEDEAWTFLQSLTGQSLEPEEAKAEPSARKHILVVDDNTVMLKLIKEHLHEKYDVATAVSGKIALKFLERKKTDLILLDYEMPEENGPAVLEQLRASEATRNIPVVFLTGVTEREKIQEALRLKPQSYLLKPVKREKLLSTIKNIIG